jgi:integrase
VRNIFKCGFLQIVVEGKDINRPKTITREQAYAIAHKLGVRERQIFLLGIETGIRISDLLRLSMSDVRRNPIRIYESKSKRVRSIQISDELHGELCRWNTRDSPSFAFYSLRDTKKPYVRMTYHRKLKEAAKVLRIDFSAHSMRKLYARNIFDKTKDIFAVQEAMNHKYITTTATYLDIDLVELIKANAPS